MAHNGSKSIYQEEARRYKLVNLNFIKNHYNIASPITVISVLNRSVI